MASNGSIFPMRSPVETDAGPETIALDDAGAVLDALSSDTARALLTRVYEEPSTASELATATGTSVQNAKYHLGHLQDVGAVEVVDTWYSEKGNRMKVYGPVNDPLVIVAGGPAEEAEVQRAVADADAEGPRLDAEPAVRTDGGRERP